MKVFISYAREDIETAKKLRYDLEKAGIKTWLDKEDLLPGQGWKLAIREAMQKSDFLIILLSSRSLQKRGYVQKELRMALDLLGEFPKGKIFIIPVRLDACEPQDEELQNLHWADLFPSYKKGLNDILHVLLQERQDDNVQYSQQNKEDIPEKKEIERKENQAFEAGASEEKAILKNENQQNIDIKGDVDKSVITDGDRNSTNQNIINVNVNAEQSDKDGKVSEKINKNSYLKAILIFVCLFFAAPVPYLWNKYVNLVKPEKIPPKFFIENRILRSDAALIIKAGNESANRKQPLTVEFDGLPFDEKGIPLDNQGDDKRQCWYFTLKDQHPPPEMLKDGAHQIRAGFVGEDSVDVQKIIFYTEIPVLRGLSYQPENEPDKRVIEGKASSNLKEAENKMAVEMVFYDEGERPVTVDIPVRYVQDSVTGASYYEFQTTIEGLPKFSSNDPNYKKPFFGLKVTDQAGNNYYQQVSYAQYIAPGDHHFGSSDLADITVEKKSSDTGNRQVINLVRLTTPPPKRVDRLQNGKPPIELKVTARTDGSRHLGWKSNVDVKALTLVYRDKKQIGVSKTDSFVDNEKLDKDSADYRVEQEGKDSTRYLSNKETFRKYKYNLRSEPITVSDKDALKTFKFKKDKDDWWRPLEYIQNDFIDNGNGTITDYATGLMWEKSGSPNYISYENAKAYVEKLQLAGHSDWRLPTVDELRSLLTPKRMNGGLFIDPIFDKTQMWCWTSDLCASGGAWRVYFTHGNVYWNNLNSNGYVRAVRSRQ